MEKESIDITRSRAADIAALSCFSSSTVHEALGQIGALASFIKPLASGMRICGPALTVDCPAGDNLALHLAIAGAEAGNVLVVDHKGTMDDGPFGEIMATACLVRGIAGLVIDGCVRDSREIQTIGFPVFARGTCIRGTTKRYPGRIGHRVFCAGQFIDPGNIILCDEDGVVVVPQSRLIEAIDAASRRQTLESEMIHKIRAGATTIELLGLAPPPHSE